MRELIKSAMAESWAIPLASIPDDAAVENFPRWDSLGHIVFMLALEARVGTKFSTEEMLRLHSVAAIEAYLTERGLPK